MAESLLNGTESFTDMTVKQIIATAVLAYVIFSILRTIYNAYFGPLSHIPGPPLLALTSIPDKIQLFRGKAFENRMQWKLKYGDLVRIGPNTVMVSQVDAVQNAFWTADLPKSTMYHRFRRDVNVSALFSETDKKEARNKRRILSHGFSVSYLRNIQPIMLKLVNRMCDNFAGQIENNGGSANVDVYNILSHFTTDVIGDTCFGESFGLLENPFNPFSTRLTAYFKRNFVVDMLFPFIKKIPILKEGDPIFNQMLEEKLSKRRKIEETGVPIRKDILAFLMDQQKQEGFSDTSLLTTMIMLLLAGGDTTSRSLALIFRFLVENTEVLKDLEREIMEYVQTVPESEPISDEKLQNLPLLNAVINETLRMFPPALSGFSRAADKDLTLCNQFIPKGTDVTIFIQNLHMDPKQYPNPNKWNPYRWLDPEFVFDKAYFFPFSQAARNCIGKGFAMTEMRLCIARTIVEFELEECDVPELKASWDIHQYLTVHLADGRYFVKMKKRVKA